MWTQRMTDRFIRDGIILPENAEVVKYGLETLVDNMDFIFMATPGDYCVPVGREENDCRLLYLPDGYGVKVIDSPHPYNMSCRIVKNMKFSNTSPFQDAI